MDIDDPSHPSAGRASSRWISGIIGEWKKLPLRGRQYFLIGLASIIVGGPGAVFSASYFWQQVFDNLHWTVSEVVAAAMSWVAWGYWKKRDGRGSIWLPLALTSYAVGQIGWDIEVAIDWLPFPAPSDSLFLGLGFLSCVGLGGVILQEFRGVRRYIVMLDVTALATFTITVLILLYVPIQGRYSMLQMIVFIAYPLSLMTATAMAFTIIRYLRFKLHWAWILYILSMLGTGLSWQEWNYLSLIHMTNESGTWLNLSFSIFDLGVGLGLLGIKFHFEDETSILPHYDAMNRAIPPIIVSVTAIVAFITLTNHQLTDFQHDVVGTAALIIMVTEAISQQMLLRERNDLLILLSDAHSELERAVIALEHRNHDYSRTWAAMEAANRAKSMFLANMSHELRTPLNAVIGFAEMLTLRAEEIPQNIRGYSSHILDAGRQLFGIVENVLAMTHMELDTIEPSIMKVELHGLIQSALRSVQEASSVKELVIDVDTPPHLMVSADRRLLRQAIMHLLSNAVKFTPRGGNVRISASQDLSGGVEIRIVDNGPGMTPDAIARAFEPFNSNEQTLSRAHGGLGIGLTLTRRLIELQGGGIEILPVTDHGIEILVRLPGIVKFS